MVELHHNEQVSQAPAPDRAKWVIPMVALLVLGGLLSWAISSYRGGAGHKKQAVAKIALLPDVAPPPPPPPPPDKKPEPEVKEDKPQPQPEDAPKPLDKAPEPEQLKMEGAAGDGPSAFGAGSVAKDYQVGDPGVGVGGGGGVNKMQFALFSGQLQRHVQASLARHNKAKVVDYRVSVQVWVAPSGELRVELGSSTGDEQSDEALKQALAQMPPMPNVPANLPQPIRLRITNRMTG